jgi:outer membrane protein TolC
MTARRKVAAAMAGPPVLWGCAVRPDFVRPDAPVTDRYTADPLPVQTASTAAAGGTAQRFDSGRDIPDEWWALFHSAALDAMIEEAVQSTPIWRQPRRRLSPPYSYSSNASTRLSKISH